MTENPFEVLRLAPTATPEEVVRQGARLAQRAADEPTRNAIRQAVRQLTGTDEERVLHALLTHPAPDYAPAVLERFQAAHRRPPAGGSAPPVPALDPEEFRRILRDTLAGQIAPPTLTLEPMETAESGEEIARQTAEAVWQGLPAQPRG
jgi:hypothetical protein